PRALRRDGVRRRQFARVEPPSPRRSPHLDRPPRRARRAPSGDERATALGVVSLSSRRPGRFRPPNSDEICRGTQAAYRTSELSRSPGLLREAPARPYGRWTEPSRNSSAERAPTTETATTMAASSANASAPAMRAAVEVANETAMGVVMKWLLRPRTEGRVLEGDLPPTGGHSSADSLGSGARSTAAGRGQNDACS